VIDMDKDAIYFAATGGVMWLLWWVWNKNQPQPIPASAVPSQSSAGGGFPIPYGQPMSAVYDANPTAYNPPTDSDLTLNINNPYASMLNSAYMPLFGFVGIAQGVEL
jgi:hypothetical protein